MRKDLMMIAEYDTYKRLITEVYQEGFVSIVSDTFNLWKVLTETLPRLKEEIMSRDGKVVIRPDSGEPADIICGTVIAKDLTNEEYCTDLEKCKAWMKEDMLEDLSEDTDHGEQGDQFPKEIFQYKGKYYEITLDVFWNRHDKQYYFIEWSDTTVKSCEEIELTSAQKGVIELLWETFGGTMTEKGYKQLDSHIGCIYGDAITIDRCRNINLRLKDKGFASTNMVYGIGSYTYQCNTRDTFGNALKTTYSEIAGVEYLLYKDPITDDGLKKSQRGLVCVLQDKETGEITFKDGFTKKGLHDFLASVNSAPITQTPLLRTIFENGKLYNETTLKDIRKMLEK